jgi:hypothetical protein
VLHGEGPVRRPGRPRVEGGTAIDRPRGAEAAAWSS